MIGFAFRALRLVFSRRGIAALAVARRAKQLSDEWYPVRVEGVSMVPTLRPGDFISVRFPKRGEPRTGQVVVVTNDRRDLIKRVIAMPGETVRGHTLGPSEFWVEGDNPSVSTDSRHLGPTDRGDIMGIARAVYWPPNRARRL